MEQMEVKLSAVINDVVHTMQKADVVDKYQKVTHYNSPQSSAETSNGAHSRYYK